MKHTPLTTLIAGVLSVAGMPLMLQGAATAVPLFFQPFEFTLGDRFFTPFAYYSADSDFRVPGYYHQPILLIKSQDYYFATKSFEYEGETFAVFEYGTDYEF